MIKRSLHRRNKWNLHQRKLHRSSEALPDSNYRNLSIISKIILQEKTHHFSLCELAMTYLIHEY